ncbi:MerR family transcriptional regulator [Nocardia africana]|uniref:HTH-type transcriptional regulator tnrA n=1 Tax=Nocardia africana TaxID=134964 RepID=A0A378WV41_9NOCA|nr:MerR family transcriptional regulator [Nocardia africana]MCC3313903.1 MerR family transcriptional regulator [Nocardia africana]SUA44712.1 HTH-type transcriptional regulator tnrA [Nocardia africana]
MEPDPSSQGHLPDAQQAVYTISVAAELAGIGVQTLRLYEQHGLISPARSAGGTRRYSGADLARLGRITRLAGQGIHLSAIARILDLEDDNTALRERNTLLQQRNTVLRAERDRLREEPDHV